GDDALNGARHLIGAAASAGRYDEFDRPRRLPRGERRGRRERLRDPQRSDRAKARKSYCSHRCSSLELLFAPHATTYWPLPSINTGQPQRGPSTTPLFGKLHARPNKASPAARENAWNRGLRGGTRCRTSLVQCNSRLCGRARDVNCVGPKSLRPTQIYFSCSGNVMRSTRIIVSNSSPLASLYGLPA